MKVKKPEFEIVKTKPNSSLRMHHWLPKGTSSKLSWHYHPEIELVYIPKGKGKLFVENAITPYENGVIILLHSNISHRCFDYGFESEDYEEYLIQVLPEQLEILTKRFPELEKIDLMLETAKQGITLLLEPRHDFFKAYFEKLYKVNPAERLFTFFEILNLLSKENYQGIEAPVTTVIAPQSMERIDLIFNFISENFMREITSEDAANLLHLTHSSFCRFFLRHTRKTFKEILNEYRIAHACKLLAHTDKSIEAIAYESGYGNQSFFNRMFKRINGITPLAYRKEWRQL